MCVGAVAKSDFALHTNHMWEMSAVLIKYTIPRAGQKTFNTNITWTALLTDTAL